MDIPWNTIGFLLIFFPLMVALAVYQAKRTKNKQYYLVGSVSCSMVLVVVVAVLGQPILSFILLFATAIVSAVLLPKMMRTARDEALETIKSTNASAPLRLRDVFSWSFIPKLERKYGVYQALAIYVAATTGITGAVLFLMSLLGITTLPMAGFGTVGALVLSIGIYLRLKKDIREGRITLT